MLKIIQNYINKFYIARLDSAKENSQKNSTIRRELIKELIPLLSIKNSPANLLGHKEKIEEAGDFIKNTFSVSEFDIQSLNDYKKSYDDIRNNPRFQVFTFAQDSISKLIKKGQLYFSEDITKYIIKYNSLKFIDGDQHEDRSNHKKDMDDLIHNLKKEIEKNSLEIPWCSFLPFIFLEFLISLVKILFVFLFIYLYI